ALILAAYVLLTVVTLARSAHSFRRLRPAHWLALMGLAVAGFVFAQLFILRVPANILPPPGLPVETRRPGLALFALVPAFVAGGWLGTGPALLVGLATGVARGA